MRYVVCLFVLALLASCNQSKEEEKEASRKVEKIYQDSSGVVYGQSLSKYTGKAGQLVVVSDNTVFTEEVATVFDTTFGTIIMPYKYPAVPKFEVYQVNEEKFFKGSRTLRNIVNIELTDRVKEGEPKMVIKRDYFAKRQLFTVFSAATMDDLLDILKKELPSLCEYYEEMEWKREYWRLKDENNTVLKRKVSEQFGITMELPKRARYESVRKNFAKIMFPDRSRQMDLTSANDHNSSKANFIQSGILIWQIPFKDSSQLDPDYLMRARDTLLKYNALHESPGVYMGTQDHPAILPVHRKIKIRGVEGYEFKGLFKFTGRIEPSGGKFWSFHFLHPKRNKIIAVSGYLDAPPTMSPMLDLRKIQAVLYSIDYLD